MPGINDYVSGYGEKLPDYDGPYLDDFDPVEKYKQVRELEPGETGFNTRVEPFTVPEDEVVPEDPEE